MKKLIYILLLLPSFLFAQETIEAYEMGDEQARGKINRNFTSICDIINIEDSTLNNIQYICFDTTFEDGSETGRLQWNIEDQTLEFGLNNNVTLQIGQESVIKVYNNTGVTIEDGKVIYTTGAFGGDPTIGLASNDDLTAMLAFGVTTESIPDGSSGFVATGGKIRGINTSSFSNGQIIYLDEDGDITSTRPVAPDFQIFIGQVDSVSATDGIIGLRFTHIPRLNFLSDVYMTGLADGDGLFWNATTSRYEAGNSRRAIKAHITSPVETAETDTWRNFTGFVKVESESGGDIMELINDSTLVCRKAGLYHFGGCIHVQNNTGGGFNDILVLSRIFKNDLTEARCSQRGYAGDIRSGGEDVLSYNGTDNLSLNDTIRLQYYTNNIDLEFDSNAAFTSQVAATIWLIYSGK